MLMKNQKWSWKNIISLWEPRGKISPGKSLVYPGIRLETELFLSVARSARGYAWFVVVSWT